LDGAVTGAVTIYRTPETSGGNGINSYSLTTTTINTIYDRQWNSAADSIADIPAGSYIEAKVTPASYAVFLGIDRAAVGSTLPSAYRYGLMVDSAGIRIFESGVQGALLSATNLTTTTLRIIRSETGQVYYQVSGGSWVASTQPPIHPSTTVEGYALLYSSLDQVTNASVGAFAKAEISVPFLIGTDFTVRADPRVVFDTATTFSFGFDPAVIFPVATTLTFDPDIVPSADVTFDLGLELDIQPTSGGRGAWTLPTPQMLGGDYAFPGTGTWTLPLPTWTGYEQVYVPAAPDEGFWIVPKPAVWGIGLDEDHGAGTATLPKPAALGAESGVVYGQGTWVLPVQVAMTSFPPWWAEDTLVLATWASGAQTLSMQREIVLVLYSTGEIADTLTLTKLQLLSLLTSLSGSSSITLQGIYQLGLLSELTGSTPVSMQSPTGAEVLTDAAVWVVNLDTAASWQYENYGFNSFFEHHGAYYGVANDGIYRLDGDTDHGAQIDALAAFVRTTLGVPGLKTLPSVYIGAASDGALIVRTDVGGVVRYYRARTSSPDMQQHRVDLGRGPRGTHWELELLNQNGDDFDIADVTLLPVVLDRRV
jgi:hypothetical protein